MPIISSNGSCRRARRKLGLFGPAILIAMPFSAPAQTVLTVTRTASSTITANTLVEEGASGMIVTANNGNCTGVALNTGTTVQVVEYGTAVVIVNTATPTVGDLVTCVAGTLGYGTDSGVIPVSGVALGVQIVGRIISVGTAGASTTPVTVQLFGPGVAGTGWLPLVNGFYQFPGTSPGNATYTDAYTYKMCAPNTGMPPSLCTPPFVPTTGPSSSYAGFWIDRGGFGLGLPAAGTTAVAPYDYELLRLSAVTQLGTRENTLEVFDYTTQGLGSVPASFFNEAGFPSHFSYTTIMYGVNSHTSGCSGTKCGGTVPLYVDSDVQQIGIESDVEERGGTGKSSGPSIGVYSVCVNCNNSGQAVMGSSVSNPNVAFKADSQIAQSGPAGATTMAWGAGFVSAPGAATRGLILNPLTIPGTASNSQDLEQCAFPTTSSTPSCTIIDTTSTLLTNFSSPGRTQFLNSAGTALSPVSFVYNQTSETASTYPLTATDQGAYWNNAGATAGVVLGLPSPTQGSVYYFTVIAALPLTVKAPAGIQICYTQAGASAPTCSVTGGTIASNVPGSFLKVYATNSVWYVEYQTGTWVGPT